MDRNFNKYNIYYIFYLYYLLFDITYKILLKYYYLILHIIYIYIIYYIIYYIYSCWFIKLEEAIFIYKMKKKCKPAPSFVWQKGTTTLTC